MKLTTFVHEAIYKDLPKHRKGGYQAIMMDPPWKYKDRINDHSRGAINHYPTLTVEQIAAFPVEDYAGKDCFLYLWTTKDFRVDAQRLFTVFGFDFKTEFIWVKQIQEPESEEDTRMGMGHYNRLCHEILLVGLKKGSSMKPKNGSREKSVFFAPITGHSAKPDVAYEIIERNCDPPYLEIFARRNRENWTSWGNEVEVVRKMRQPESPCYECDDHDHDSSEFRCWNWKACTDFAQYLKKLDRWRLENP